MKTWKKIFIVALCLIGLTGVIFASLVADGYYHRYHNFNYKEADQYVSENIVMEHSVHHRSWGEMGYVRLKDIRTGKYTTPKIQHVFLNYYQPQDSIAVFRDMKHKRGYINLNTGKIVIPAAYDRAWNFSEGLAAVMLNGRIRFINEQGSFAFDTQYPILYDDDYKTIAPRFHGGTCAIRNLQGNWGLINTHGEWIVEPIYSRIDNIYHGYHIVYKESVAYGLLRADGSVALPLEYDHIARTEDGSGFTIVKDGVGQEVDFNLQTTRSFVCDNVYPLPNLSVQHYSDYDYDYSQNEFFCYELCGKCGVIDAKGKVIIPAKYTYIEQINDNLFRAKLYNLYDSPCLIINSKGEIVN